MATRSSIMIENQPTRFTNNCFPARTRFLGNQPETGAGAWLVARNAEEQSRIRTILHTKPRTFKQIREWRQKAEKNGTAIDTAAAASVLHDDDDDEEDADVILDGFFLLKFCAAQDPSDLCTANVSGQGLTDCKPNDFLLFDNVTVINASENLLPLESFTHFPGLRKLEIALNGIRGIKLTLDQFPCLQELDISYNNLSASDVLILGLLSHLRILNISGNSLSSLPNDMSYPALITSDDETQAVLSVERFPMLEELVADDNKLTEASVFTAAVGLRKLQVLSFAKNKIAAIPHLLLTEGRYVIVEDSSLMGQIEKKRELNETTQRHHPVSSEEENAIETNSRLHCNDPELDMICDSSTELNDKFCSPELNSIPKNVSEIDTRNLESHANNELLPAPFSNLRCLNLSYNRITDERSLLSVASWPNFRKLIIHNNPLTTESRSELLILRKFLHDRFGTLIQRNKEPEIEKPHLRISKSSKKIKSQVPLIPRCKIQDLVLAIEGPKPSPTDAFAARVDAAPQRPSSSGAIGASAKPLPPIPRCRSSKTRRGSSEEKNGKEKEAPLSADDLTLNNGSCWSEGSSDPIFMTEMMNDILIGDVGKEGKESDLHLDLKETKKMEEEEADEFSDDDMENVAIQNKYKGYEELLTLDGTEMDGFLPPANDVNGNVRALRHILSHPLIFRDKKVHLDKKQKPFQPLIKKAEFASKPAKTRNEKAASVLDNLKLRPTFTEAPLAVALSQKSYEKEFRDARKLLGEVQLRYCDARKTPPTEELSRNTNKNEIRPLFGRL